MRISRGIATLSIAGLTLVGVGACSSDEPAEDATTSTSSAAAEPEETETTEADEPEETEEAAPAGDGTTASWANPVTTPGTLLTTITADSYTVDVYQVGVTQATKTGQFANPDTNEPIIAVGADIVFVNYVITNTSDETIPLGASLVNIDARYVDWPYMGGMDSVVDRDLFAAQDVNADAAKADSYVDPYVLDWEPGTQFSYGENFLHQAGSPLELDIVMTPTDEAGDLVHDKKVEVTGEATIS